MYRGTSSNEAEASSFWNQYDRVICTNNLSKPYGLAGLRIGWMVAAPGMIEEMWRTHEYAVIAAAGPSMTLAETALQSKSARVLRRQRELSRITFVSPLDRISAAVSRFATAAR